MPDAHRYDDIIDLPHPVSATHPPMSPEKRAAQFAPFAALTGFGEMIEALSRMKAMGDGAFGENEPEEKEKKPERE